jgi:hypothetical protein
MGLVFIEYQYPAILAFAWGPAGDLSAIDMTRAAGLLILAGFAAHLPD